MLTITEKIKKELDQVRAKYGLSLILLHGSQIDGKTHPESDIDLAILPKDNDFDLVGLISELIGIFQSDKIDVANLKNANPLLLFSVAKDARLLSGEDSDFDDFQFRAFKRYVDYLPRLKEEEIFIKEKLSKI